MHKHGVLRKGQSGNWVWQEAESREETGRIGYICDGHSLQLNYRSRDWGCEWESITDTICLSKTYPNFGGERNWFICPNCHKRRGMLYGGKYFRCRECYGACYQTQLEDAKSRAMTKIYRRRHKLGEYGGLGEPFPQKPKWMRWATYNRLWVKDVREREALYRMEWIWLEKLHCKI
jgi:hypothetical protein